MGFLPALGSLLKAGTDEKSRPKQENEAFRKPCFMRVSQRKTEGLGCFLMKYRK